MATDTMRAYHFLKENMRAGYGTERAWRIGEQRTLTGPLDVCVRGYHSSPTWRFALKYAPGPIACLVEISGDTYYSSDKQVSRTRKLVACANVERELRLWLCDVAARRLRAERKLGREPHEQSLRAVRVARRYAHGKATPEELAAARIAAATQVQEFGDDAAYVARMAASVFHAMVQFWADEACRSALVNTRLTRKLDAAIASALADAEDLG